MIMSSPGDPIWLREGILITRELPQLGLPVGIVLHKPCRGIFLEKKVMNSKTYIKAYVDNFGERYIEEDDVLEMSERFL